MPLNLGQIFELSNKELKIGGHQKTVFLSVNCSVLVSHMCATKSKIHSCVLIVIVKTYSCWLLIKLILNQKQLCLLLEII